MFSDSIINFRWNNMKIIFTPKNFNKQRNPASKPDNQQTKLNGLPNLNCSYEFVCLCGWLPLLFFLLTPETSLPVFHLFYLSRETIAGARQSALVLMYVYVYICITKEMKTNKPSSDPLFEHQESQASSKQHQTSTILCQFNLNLKICLTVVCGGGRIEYVHFWDMQKCWNLHNRVCRKIIFR